MPSTSKSSEDFVNVTISGNEITESDIQTEKLTSKSRDPLEALSKSILAASNLEAMAEPGTPGTASSSRVSMAELNISSDTLNEISEQDFSCTAIQDSPQFANFRTSSPIPEPMSKNQSNESLPILPNQKDYDYLLKILLVGDST